MTIYCHLYHPVVIAQLLGGGYVDLHAAIGFVSDGIGKSLCGNVYGATWWHVMAKAQLIDL
ncbi:hypothetical protein MBAV_006294 [Candidatus Magnetobacterium bavaricum]|uniref:Uncharacterized protein n=1 Tax=Candidatus Magnetobacterium bavaricum TaxID=29290 RepID=A0A0F3GHT3_9BACT|nr:hypothetical protein MBAV_006294 [Candidatus Magnetobacterium bavaricum]